MRNATIHAVKNGWVVAFSMDKECWEYVFLAYVDMQTAIQKWFLAQTLP